MSPGTSTGRVVAGRYRIVAPIGSGGHGVVDLAEDLLNGGRRVALKRLEGIVGAGDPEPAADHLRWFRHPRWAEILDEGRLDAHGRFQVVRYVEGKSLDHLELPRPADEILTFLEDGARVLGALHARGLIHYDVTPGNVLREERPDGVVFTLTDGGLANLGPVRGIARGTVMYMAPEVADGAPHDHRVDLYALGLVAFRLATGRDPWIGGAGEVLGGRRKEPAPSIRRFLPDADARLERVIACLLERDPNRRVADAQALLALLAEVGRASAGAPLAGEYYAEAAGGFILGRDAEIARFRAACRALLAGPTPSPIPASDGPAAITAPATPVLHDNVLIVHGPAGSGGTRLVEEYVAIARSEGVPVLALSGREGAADRRGPLRRLADGISLLTGQADALGASGRAEGRPGRDDPAAGDDVRMTERFVALCDRTAERSPLVLVVADFDEFPAAAQEAVRVLARHLLSRSEHPDGRAPARILLVVDHGAAEPDGFLLPDAAEPRRPVQLLEPLPSSAIRSLVAERFQGIDPVPEDIETVRSVTEGLPRLVISVLAQARERGDLRKENGLWLWNASQTATYPLDRRISPAAARALAALSPEAHEVAQYLALLEVPVPEEFLRRLASPASIAEFAASPLASVSNEGGGIRVALRGRPIRQIILQIDVNASRHRLLRGDASATVVPLELVPEMARVALHAGHADRAIQILAAPDSLQPPAWNSRAQPVALAALRSVGGVNSRERERLARLLTPSAIAEELALAIRESFPVDLTTEDFPAIGRIARYYVRSQCPQLAIPLLDRAAEILRASPTVDLDSARFGVSRFRAHCVHRPDQPHADTRRGALLELRRLGRIRRRVANELVAEYYLSRGRTLIAAGAWDTATSIHRRAIRRSLAGRDRELLVASINNSAICHKKRGNLLVAERYLLRALRVRLATGDAAGAAGQAHNLARVYQQGGRLRDAASLLHRSVSLAIRHGQFAAQSFALGLLAELHDQLGNTALARSTSLRALASSRQASNARLLLRNALVSAELASAVGRGTEARSLLSLARQTARGILPDREAKAVRLTAMLVSMNLGTRQSVAPRSIAAWKHTSLRRLLRLTRGSNAVGLSLFDDLARGPRGATLRRLLASSAMNVPQSKSPAPASWLLHLESLKSPTLKGPTRRLGLSTLVATLHLRGVEQVERSERLRRAAEVAQRFNLPLLAARALALVAHDAVNEDDFLSAADSITATVDAMEATQVGSSEQRGWPLRVLPFELRRLVGRLIQTPAFASTPVGAQQDYRIVLHAMAHRLARLSARSIGVDARRESALRAVLAAAGQLKAGLATEQLLSVLSDHARTITHADRACVVLVSPVDGERRVAGDSMSERSFGGSDALSRTVIERALSSRSPVLLHDVYGDSELMTRPSILAMSLRSVLCVPLVRGREVFGVMYADRSDGAGAFDRVDLEVLSLFAEQAAAALETGKLFTDLQNSYLELKTAQDRLLRGERLRVIGEMTSGVAHEFNNLLTAILARVQLMEMGELSDDVRTHLRLIEKASLDAAAVVRRLQGFSRSQRQGNHRIVDVAELGADVVELLRPMWTTRRRQGRPAITVRYRASRGLFVQGDSTELREVFTNLIKNALDAVDAKGGLVSINVREEGLGVRTEVEDDGGGIAPEILSRLFTPFLTTKGERGTGLGLCLCQQILERHGSVLRVTSDAPRGTRVAFDLARVRADATSSRTPSPTLPGEDEPRIRVLVVDDDPDVLKPLCDYLSRSGLIVFGAESAARALEMYDTSQPDVVVSDIAMPGMDGIELCSILRKRHHALVVVLMSGQASDIEITRLRDSGATALLPKPFTMRQMLELLQSVSRRSAGPAMRTAAVAE